MFAGQRRLQNGGKSRQEHRLPGGTVVHYLWGMIGGVFVHVWSWNAGGFGGCDAVFWEYCRTQSSSLAEFANPANRIASSQPIFRIYELWIINIIYKYTLPTCMHTHIYIYIVHIQVNACLCTLAPVYTSIQAICISSIRFTPSGLRRLALQRWRQAIDVSRQWHAMNDQAWGVDSTWVDGLMKGGSKLIHCRIFLFYLSTGLVNKLSHCQGWVVCFCLWRLNVETSPARPDWIATTRPCRCYGCLPCVGHCSGFGAERVSRRKRQLADGDQCCNNTLSK